MAILPNELVLRHVVDAHCHPTDAPQISHETMQGLSITVCAMATRQSDQQRVRDLALQYPDKVIPCFGYHPWFSYTIAAQSFASKRSHYQTLLLGTSDSQDLFEAFEKLLPHLPEPRHIDDVILELRNNLGSFPGAMLGEVGLDRSFRIPIDYLSSPRELTPFTIPLEHQLTILEAQLDLAVELGRNVSLHSVKCQQATTALLSKMRSKHGERWCRINIDFHSCGFSPEMWQSVENEHPNTFLSLSVVINGKKPSLKHLIAACAPDRILVESDYDNAEMTTPMTWEMILIVAEVKGWQVEDKWGQDLNPGKVGAVRQLEENWKRFKNGNPTKGHT